MRNLFFIVVLAAGCASKPEEKPPEVKPDGPPPICAVESPELCLQDGVDLEVGARGEPDPKAARGKYELACEGGLPRGCTRLGALLAASDEPFDRLRVLDLWRDACAADEPMACAQLGSHLLANAFHADESNPERDEMYRSAHDLLGGVCGAEETADTIDHWGITVRGYSCANLAAAYESGLGVEADIERAKQLYQSACGLGWAEACSVLESL